MKTTFYIGMTSGIQGPELELTPEQAQPIIDLAAALTEKWEGPTHPRMPSPDHYILSWEIDDKHYGLMTDISGFTRRWTEAENNTDWAYFKDTVGLWQSLASYASEAYQKWVQTFS